MASSEPVSLAALEPFSRDSPDSSRRPRRTRKIPELTQAASPSSSPTASRTPASHESHPRSPRQPSDRRTVPQVLLPDAGISSMTRASIDALRNPRATSYMLLSLLPWTPFPRIPIPARSFARLPNSAPPAPFSSIPRANFPAPTRGTGTCSTFAGLSSWSADRTGDDGARDLAWRECITDGNVNGTLLFLSLQRIANKQVIMAEGEGFEPPSPFRG